MSAPLVFVVEDDADLRQILSRVLTGAGLRCECAPDPVEAEAMLVAQTPDLILLDVMMPRMSGYEFCARLQHSERFAAVPVVIMTALDSAPDKARAFAAGAAGFVAKPMAPKALLEAVRGHLGARSRWEGLARGPVPPRREDPSELGRFKAFLAGRAGVPAESLAGLSLAGVYAAASTLGLSREQVARLSAEHAGLEYCPSINPDHIRLGVLPARFALAHGIVALEDERGAGFVVADPFQAEALELLRRGLGEENPRVLVTDPEKLTSVLERRGHEETAAALRADREAEGARIEAIPISEVGDHLLEAAVYGRASDVHLEPKEGGVKVRFRVDGDLRDAYTLKGETGLQVISRFKALAGLDLAERRKPQDGSMSATVGGRSFILRLATTSTPEGESLVVRLLEPWARPKHLSELGMTPAQVQDMEGFARRKQGLVLVAGPTGSGKTTTIYSLVQHIDCVARSLISIEDPVEYRILAANQQQVDEKAGLTFEALLKSSLRQDPDILFLGEMRDQYSAKMAVDFASTGHLTISTIHTANATTAIFRLERVGVSRGAMADSILGVIAQKLVKRLCPRCKVAGPITPEEAGWLAPFTERVPERVARPAGCPECAQTGFQGREGVYEIVKFYPEISEMIRRGAPISEIRDFARGRGDYLIGQHAVEKVRDLLCSPRVVYENVLIEEAEYRGQAAPGPAPQATASGAPATPPSQAEELIGKPAASAPEAGGPIGAARSVLVVEDDPDTRALIARVLTNRGYEVTAAADGVEALLQIGRRRFDLILSDIEMPNLDGLKLMEMKALKGIAAPVVFLTGRAEAQDELKAFELGAEDYIRKPVTKEVLLARVNRALGGRG